MAGWRRPLAGKISVRTVKPIMGAEIMRAYLVLFVEKWSPQSILPEIGWSQAGSSSMKTMYEYQYSTCLPKPAFARYTQIL